MAIFAVTYTYSDDAAGRDEHRPAHREYLGKLGERGVNRCSGPFGSADAPGALLLLEAGSKEEAIAYTEDDPFRVNGLVADMSVQEWLPVLGDVAKHFE